MTLTTSLGSSTRKVDHASVTGRQKLRSKIMLKDLNEDTNPLKNPNRMEESKRGWNKREVDADAVNVRAVSRTQCTGASACLFDGVVRDISRPVPICTDLNLNESAHAPARALSSADVPISTRHIGRFGGRRRS